MGGTAVPRPSSLLRTSVAFGPRWVGEGLAAYPHDVPWQRVINWQGKISQRPGAER